MRWHCMHLRRKRAAGKKGVRALLLITQAQPSYLYCFGLMAKTSSCLSLIGSRSGAYRGRQDKEDGVGHRKRTLSAAPTNARMIHSQNQWL